VTPPRLIDMTPIPEGPLAFSYIRFSTREQKKGDSLRRQTAATLAWCQRNGARLDTSRSFHDLGKSAFLGEHRKNPDRHALAAFLKMVEEGRIPRGSYLVIESLDRLTREHVRPALMLCLGLIEAGIRIVQLSPTELVYDERADEISIILMIVELSRGHRESKRKSDLIGPAWAEKKQAAREGRPQPEGRGRVAGGTHILTRQVPFWVEAKGGVLALIPARAAAVRRIFELSAGGYGMTLICRRLRKEGVPAFGTSGGWQKSYVGRILRDRRALGEHQPRHRDGSPDGDPIPGYFPAVVTQQEWDACRGRVGRRRNKPGRVGDHINLFQGLLKDARSGGGYYSTWRFNNRARTASYRVLLNNSGQEGKARQATFPEAVFEEAVLGLLREVDPSAVTGRETSADEVLTLSAELARVEATLALVVADLDEHGDSPALYKRLRAKEAEKRALAARLAEARQRAAHPRSASWGSAQTLITALAAAPDVRDARLRLRGALREIIDSIFMLVVPRGQDRFCAVQVFFADDGTRNYLIFHRAARGNARCRHEARWWARSFKAAGLDEGIDLRRPEKVRLLEAALAAADLSAFET
jgi:DNA invertase Pin-like site-specific DNA recombinase